MANRLTKLAKVSTTPSSPGQVGHPRYCRTFTTKVPAYQSVGWTSGILDDGRPFVNYYFGDYYPATTRTKTYCYPAQPYIPATPAKKTHTSITGWNGGGRSIAQLDKDGYVEFQVRASPYGVSVGLSQSNESQLPSEPSHSFYFTGTTVTIMEFGDTVATVPNAHAYGTKYRITRSSGAITYSTSDGWERTSALPLLGATFLDSAMYASGDYVDNPVLVNEVIGGSGAGSLRPLFGIAFGTGATGRQYAMAHLGALTGVGGSVFVVRGAGSMAPLAGVAAESAGYTYGSGTLPLLIGDANGGYPEVHYIAAYGVLGRFVGVSLGLTGGVGQADGTLRPMDGIASEGPYGDARGTLRALRGYGDSGSVVPNYKETSDLFLLGDLYVPSASTSKVTYADGLGLGDEYVGDPVISGAIYDALSMDDAMSVTQALEAFIASSLAIGNEVTGALRLLLPGGVIPGEPLQYAVNAQTGALTTYTGFGFGAYARASQNLYGCKSDGVYRVRSGDDDGAPIQASVDFGDSDYDSTKKKNIESVYLGVSTDGDIFANVTSDGVTRSYRAAPRVGMLRATAALGVSSRMWGISLEIVDATEFDMDVMEVQFGLSTARWRSK